MKAFVYGVAAALVLVAGGCGKSGGNGGNEGSGGNELRAALEENIRIMEAFCEAMDKADNAEKTTEALNQYTLDIEKLAPKFQSLLEKHPELADIATKSAYPEGFEDFEDRFAAAAPKMMQAMMKAMRFGSDPKVKEAEERMLEAAGKLTPGASR